MIMNQRLFFAYRDFIASLTKKKWESYLSNGHPKFKNDEQEYMLALYHFEDEHDLSGYYFTHINDLKAVMEKDIEGLLRHDFNHEKWREEVSADAHKDLSEIATMGMKAPCLLRTDSQ